MSNDKASGAVERESAEKVQDITEQETDLTDEEQNQVKTITHSQ